MQRSDWRTRLHAIIFEADTPKGRAFDVVLLVLIMISVGTVCMESVASFRADHGPSPLRIEWVLTGLFTIEYVLRLLIVDRPLHYARSVFGLVDLASVLPSYLSLLAGTSPSLMMVRALRLLRVFRVLKLAHFVNASDRLTTALAASRPKIIVFLSGVPTGIVGAQLAISGSFNGRSCPGCGAEGHPTNAVFCHRCADPL